MSSLDKISAALGFATKLAIKVFSRKINLSPFFVSPFFGPLFLPIGLMIFAVLVIVMPVIHGLPVSSAHRSYGFFEKVSESRLYICIWSVGFTGGAFLAWFAVFFEVSRIFKRSK
jgi:hypothetical protein